MTELYFISRPTDRGWIPTSRLPSGDGTLATMLIAELVANPYALQPLAERFFVASGFVFATRAVAASRTAASPAP